MSSKLHLLLVLLLDPIFIIWVDLKSVLALLHKNTLLCSLWVRLKRWFLFFMTPSLKNFDSLMSHDMIALQSIHQSTGWAEVFCHLAGSLIELQRLLHLPDPLILSSYVMIRYRTYTQILLDRVFINHLMQRFELVEGFLGIRHCSDRTLKCIFMSPHRSKEPTNVQISLRPFN